MSTWEQALQTSKIDHFLHTKYCFLHFNKSQSYMQPFALWITKFIVPSPLNLLLKDKIIPTTQMSHTHSRRPQGTWREQCFPRKGRWSGVVRRRIISATENYVGSNNNFILIDFIGFGCDERIVQMNSTDHGVRVLTLSAGIKLFQPRNNLIPTLIHGAYLVLGVERFEGENNIKFTDKWWRALSYNLLLFILFSFRTILQADFLSKQERQINFKKHLRTEKVNSLHCCVSGSFSKLNTFSFFLGLDAPHSGQSSISSLRQRRIPETEFPTEHLRDLNTGSAFCAVIYACGAFAWRRLNFFLK